MKENKMYSERSEMTRKFITTTFVLDAELLRAVAAKCKSMDVNRSQFVRHAIRFYLAMLEKDPEVEKPDPALRLE